MREELESLPSSEEKYLTLSGQLLVLNLLDLLVIEEMPVVLDLPEGHIVSIVIARR